MATYIDDDAVPLAGEDLDAVLASAKESLDPVGRVVVEVKMNGRLLLGRELDAARKLPVRGVEIRLGSANLRELADITLQQTRTQLDDARRAQLEAADLFQRDKADEAIAQIGQALDIWLQTQKAVQTATALLNINLDEKVFEDQPVSGVIATLITRLTALRDMMAAHDTVGLADALQYEWSETVEQWQRLIGQILEWVEGGVE